MPNIYIIYSIYKFGGPKFIDIINITNIYNFCNIYDIFNIYNLIVTGSRKCQIFIIFMISQICINLIATGFRDC